MKSYKSFVGLAGIAIGLTAGAWAAEIERRQDEIESGAVSMLPGPEGLADLKAEFQ